MALTTVDSAGEVDTSTVWLPPADASTPEAMPVAFAGANDNDVVDPVPN